MFAKISHLYPEILRKLLQYHSSLHRETHPMTRPTIGTLNSIDSEFVNPLKIPVIMCQSCTPEQSKHLLLWNYDHGVAVAPDCGGRQFDV